MAASVQARHRERDSERRTCVLGAIGRRAFFPSVPQTQTSRYVTGVNKTTNAATLTYDPWGGVRLDDALLRMERASARTMAEEMAARWCGKKEGLG